MELKDELLKGAEEIGDYINEPPKRVYYLAARGLIPCFKIGFLLHARRSALNRRYGGDDEAAQ